MKTARPQTIALAIDAAVRTNPPSGFTAAQQIAWQKHHIEVIKKLQKLKDEQQ